MKFGLSKNTLDSIRGVFSKHPEVHMATLYGSRARGDYRNGSDIDLTLHGEGLNLSLLFKIENELDDLLLPYKIDLSIYRQISDPDVLERIKDEGEVFWVEEENLTF